VLYRVSSPCRLLALKRLVYVTLSPGSVMPRCWWRDLDQGVRRGRRLRRRLDSIGLPPADGCCMPLALAGWLALSAAGRFPVLLRPRTACVLAVTRLLRITRLWGMWRANHSFRLPPFSGLVTLAPFRAVIFPPLWIPSRWTSWQHRPTNSPDLQHELWTGGQPCTTRGGHRARHLALRRIARASQSPAVPLIAARRITYPTRARALAGGCPGRTG